MLLCHSGGAIWHCLMLVKRCNQIQPISLHTACSLPHRYLSLKSLDKRSLRLSGTTMSCRGALHKEW